MIESMLQDARRAARVLLGSPGLLVVSVLSLGLGLGVNLTLFTAVRATFFHTPGTRVALGAASGDILRGVLMQGLRLVVAGIAIGALASWLLARALVAGLAGLSPADPVAFGGASLILLLVGLAACYFPARRAASLNPVEALRVE